MTTTQKIAFGVGWHALDLGFFALWYLCFTAIWRVDPAWAVGASVVMVLSRPPKWGGA